MRALIDTNIIIDTLSHRKPFFEVSILIFNHCAIQTVNMFITSKQITDIYYVLRKNLKDKDTIEHALSNLLNLFEICDINKEDCINALSSNIPDYEDAVLESLARRLKMDCIVTRDKHFGSSKIHAISPEDFVHMIKA